MYTVVDIETAGLSPYKDDIIQFAYLRMDSQLRFMQSGCMYFWYPGMVWGAEHIHHIPESKAREYADDYEDNLRRMYTILAGADVIGHNCDSFDIPFIRQYLARKGLEGMNVNGSFDTMSIFRPVYKKKMKLGDLAASLGITPDLVDMCCKGFFGVDSQAHDARYDVTMTELIFAQAIRRGVL